MINNTFFLFPGQGAQFPGMALDLFEAGDESVKRLFSLASEIFGKDMIELLRSASPEELKRTDVSQPAITLANLAAAAYLAEKGLKPSGAAGFSLGEYSALAAAGVINEEDCLYLVTRRGEAMQAAIDRINGRSEGSSDTKPPGMAAVIGLAPEQVEALIAGWRKDGLTELNAANINSPRQVAVSGSAAALEEAEKRFKEAGAKRFMRLQVAGPYHSPFMKEAAAEFDAHLDKVRFNDPAIPIFSNVTGKQMHSGEEAKALAHRHILEGVRWTDEEASIALLAPEALLEVGPGKVLQGLWKDTGSAIHCCGAGTAAEIEELSK
ncbi:MAG: ACP S-malonyltransferase [Treponema sp.]|jgi:[acyl-carrier-protein] S-malonyltransferase|nr:ACP S-malonyltransferase [Treponema sp.]